MEGRDRARIMREERRAREETTKQADGAEKTREGEDRRLDSATGVEVKKNGELKNKVEGRVMENKEGKGDEKEEEDEGQEGGEEEKEEEEEEKEKGRGGRTRKRTKTRRTVEKNPRKDR